jgi:hypothetical protein
MKPLDISALSAEQLDEVATLYRTTVDCIQNWCQYATDDLHHCDIPTHSWHPGLAPNHTATAVSHPSPPLAIFRAYPLTCGREITQCPVCGSDPRGCLRSKAGLFLSHWSILHTLNPIRLACTQVLSLLRWPG